MQQEIVNTWGNIQALPANSRIRLALRRWGNLSERFHEDDAMIDYWIALEALFVPESTQEVRYRASLRVAAFIGATTEERVRVYKDLRNSYDLRSAIVHGRVPKSEQKLNLIGETRSYLRKALLKVLADYEPFNPESIESNLLK